MKVKTEKTTENQVKLEIEVDVEQVDEALDQAYQKVVQDVELPGFRKGKVPRKILEQKYGEEVLHKDALNVLYSEVYPEAVEEADLNPIDQPELLDFDLKQGEPAELVFEVEVEPEVELGDYTDLEVEKEEAEVTEEEIEQELEARRQRNAQLAAVDRERVEDGDFVTIDFEGTIDGEPFEGGSAEDYNLEIGSEQFIPGFEDQLVGTQVDQTVTVEATFPDGYQKQEIAGEEAVFEVTIKEIKEKEVPELDDEFAKDLGFDSLEEMEADIREDIADRKQQQVEREYENKLVEGVVDNVEVTVPETMVDSQIDSMMQQMKMQAQQQGIDFDDYMEMTGMDESSLRDQHWEEAENRVKSNLALDAIAEEEELEVSEEELDEKLTEIAEAQDQDKEQVKAFLQMQGQLEMLKENLKREKAIDFLKENN